MSIGKRGRKNGSSDNVKITIEALLEVLPKGEKSVIEVRRKWLEGIENILDVKFNVEETERAKMINVSLDGPEQKTVVIDGKDEAATKTKVALVEEEL